MGRENTSQLLNYILPVSIIRNASDDVITDVFSRINSYGHRLSDQERRQAGLTSEFSSFVRSIACEIRGDVSSDKLPLHQMPEISIDLPKVKQKYGIQASNVFWMQQGVLRSTDLRDSVDEQVIADIACCILLDKLIERSKDALDKLYEPTSDESKAVNNKLSSYPQETLRSEFMYCKDVIETIVKASEYVNLRSIIFKNRTTNAFPNIFSQIFLAIHEISFGDLKVLADPVTAAQAIENIYSQLKDARKAEGRRSNIDAIKGWLNPSFINGDVSSISQNTRTKSDVAKWLRLSTNEISRFEMKQGILRLDRECRLDENIFSKVINTICGMANIGKDSTGIIIIGVADDIEDANRIKTMDNIDLDQIGDRWIVGIEREAKIMNLSKEKYYQKWRVYIDNSKLTDPLKADVLNRIEICSYGTKSIIVIPVPSKNTVSKVGDELFIRKGDETAKANVDKILATANRFSNFQ